MSSFRRHPIGSALLAIPPVTLGILVTCIVTWFVYVATAGSWRLWSWLELSVPGLIEGRIWQLLTYQALHDPRGGFHLIFNMLSVGFFCPRLEQRWGSAGFLRFFLTCGVGGGLAFALVALLLRDPHPVIGASGAILGALVATAFIWPHARIMLMFVISLEMRHAILLIVLIDLILAWLGSMGGSATGAVAHLGGALTGWLYLAHAWRLRKLMPSRSPRQAFVNWRRRRRLKVVDRDFDAWLKQQDDDTRH